MQSLERDLSKSKSLHIVEDRSRGRPNTLGCDRVSSGNPCIQCWPLDTELGCCLRHCNCVVKVLFLEMLTKTNYPISIFRNGDLQPSIVYLNICLILHIVRDYLVFYLQIDITHVQFDSYLSSSSKCLNFSMILWYRVLVVHSIN